MGGEKGEQSLWVEKGAHGMRSRLSDIPVYYEGTRIIRSVVRSITLECDGIRWNISKLGCAAGAVEMSITGIRFLSSSPSAPL